MKNENFQHPLFFLNILKQNTVGTSTAAGEHKALIEPVGIKPTEVELRRKDICIGYNNMLNISLPCSYKTSCWLSGMTKDDRDA